MLLASSRRFQLRSAQRQHVCVKPGSNPMPPPNLPVPKAAQPRHGASFDPWNSSSTGHQRPENGGGGTGWRDSRNKKLTSQFRSGSTGGVRLSDSWGQGSEDYDEKLRAIVPKELKERKGRTVMDMLKLPGKMEESLSRADSQISSENAAGHLTSEETLMEQRRVEDDEKEARRSRRGLFDGVVVYVNGSTFPLISDHKLKHLLSENGGQMSTHLGRRRVTHVIVGRPAGPCQGAGGGLAGGKLEKEIKKVSGCGVKFVGVEWVLESLKAGKRLPEARFSNMKVAAKAQGSVYGLYSAQTTKASDSQTSVHKE